MSKAKLYHFLNVSKIGSAITITLILISIAAFTIETEFPLNGTLKLTTLIIGYLFFIEYLLRIWTADYTAPGLRPRFKYIFSFAGLVDLLAFLPILFTASGNASVALRLLRLLRLAQILKIKALSHAIKNVVGIIYKSRIELGLTLIGSLMFIFLGAVLMYIIEGPSQPEAFGSIPRALWWSMAALTTVGYGDVYPITASGKIVAAFIAFMGVAVVAMPAGILAGAFARQKATE